VQLDALAGIECNTRAVGRFGRDRVWQEQQPATPSANLCVHCRVQFLQLLWLCCPTFPPRLTHCSLHFVLMQQTLLNLSKALSAAPPPLTTAADGIPAESLTLDETTTLLRGPSGSSVALTVAPRGPAQQTPRQLLLERRPLPQPAVKVRHTADSTSGSSSTRRLLCQHSSTSNGRR
jgi:hypothetical protein